MRDAATLIRSQYKMWPPLQHKFSAEASALARARDAAGHAPLPTKGHGEKQSVVLPFDYYLEHREEQAAGQMARQLLADVIADAPSSSDLCMLLNTTALNDALEAASPALATLELRGQQLGERGALEPRLF